MVEEAICSALGVQSTSPAEQAPVSAGVELFTISFDQAAAVRNRTNGEPKLERI
jgi:hypothetical protein